MRRTAIGVALLAALAIFAAPASAQVQEGWFLNAGVGPAFGTLGSVPAVDGTGGYRFNEHVSVAGEFGVLPHAPFDKAGVIAPAVSPLVPTADLRVNGSHANGNLTVQPGIWGRVEPYATVGVGTFRSRHIHWFDSRGGSRWPDRVPAVPERYPLRVEFGCWTDVSLEPLVWRECRLSALHC